MTVRNRTLTLPHPPSTNTLYATVRGRRVKTEAGRNYAQEAGMIARLVFPEPLTERVQVAITVYPRSASYQDLDNVLKNLLDALTGVCWQDDRQIWRLTVERAEKRPQGALTVCIEAYEETE